MTKKQGLGLFIGTVGVLLVAIALWTLRQPLQQLWEYARRSPAKTTTIRFAVVGDNHGVNPVYQQIISELADKPMDFLLNVADTSEDGTAAEFSAVRQLESSLRYPVYHTVGNHDIDSNGSRGTFTRTFDQPAWGVRRLPGIRLIILDNADRKVGFSTDQLEALEEELEQTYDGVTILAYHRPFDLPLTALVGDDETTTSRRSNNRLLAILRAHPVDYIFTGHIHTYLPYSVAGIPAVVSGGGGDPAQTAIGGEKNNYFHYLEVTVRGQQISVQVHRVTLHATE